MVRPLVEVHSLLDGPRSFAARVFLFDCEARVAIPAGNNIELRRQLRFILADLLLPDMKVVNTQIVPCNQLHRLPDPLGNISRTPVPTVVVRRFTCVWVRGDSAFAHELHLAHCRQLIRFGLHLWHHQRDGRVENDPKRVLPPVQAIFCLKSP